LTKYLYIRSPILKILIGIGALLFTFAVILLITLTEEPRMELQAQNWNARSIENGAALYANNCSSCHGADGKGLPGVAPALQSHYFFTQRLGDVGYAGSLESYVLLTVAAGRPSKTNTQWAQVMPTWGNTYGGPFRPDQVQQVTDYVLNFQDAALQQAGEPQRRREADGVRPQRRVALHVVDGQAQLAALERVECVADGPPGGLDRGAVEEVAELLDRVGHGEAASGRMWGARRSGAAR